MTKPRLKLSICCNAPTKKLHPDVDSKRTITVCSRCGNQIWKSSR